MKKNFDGIVVKEGYELKMFMKPKYGNYCIAIIHREAVDDYVFCTGYDTTDGSWGQGHYCLQYVHAIDLIVEYLRKRGVVK